MSDHGVPPPAWGLTASRGGATLFQLDWISKMLAASATVGSTEIRRTLHHGDCVGGDAQVHDVAELLGLYIVVHPPLVNKYRAFKQPRLGEVREPRDYLARNRDIVAESTTLLALPAAAMSRDVSTWGRPSGTWTTVRYALQASKPVFVVLPDGTRWEPDAA